eukprot:CAMPEP_0180197782 /NCGR_PEP_ID=MMETSP0987-20121128/4812_1 /TAXON_ID=697907 /ORGANISM="non described non described, Strain CCMP2293" /LENGTH=109 /DNA_ID=CAMNT_0022152729 /DNA_START=460 /DNA_END=786 /DNA_ORIENTATION=-
MPKMYESHADCAHETDSSGPLSPPGDAWPLDEKEAEPALGVPPRAPPVELEPFDCAASLLRTLCPGIEMDWSITISSVSLTFPQRLQRTSLSILPRKMSHTILLCPGFF